MTRRPPDPLPLTPWEAWLPRFAAAYRVGPDDAHHVTILGPTGTGKTHLALHVAALRRYVLALGTKTRDRPFARALTARGYWKAPPPWQIPHPDLHPRAVIWPPYTGPASRPLQAAVFRSVLNGAMRAGGWHVVCEEMGYMARSLGMADDLRDFVTQARSTAAGLIGCTQRPRWVPLELLSNAQHLLIFGTNDREDLDRLAGLNGVDSDAIRHHVAGLGKGTYKFLHVDLTTGNLMVSQAPPPKGSQ